MKTPEGGKSETGGTKKIILGPALAPGPPHKNTEGKTYHWCGVSPLLNGSKPPFLKHPERFRYEESQGFFCAVFCSSANESDTTIGGSFGNTRYTYTSS